MTTTGFAGASWSNAPFRPACGWTAQCRIPASSRARYVSSREMVEPTQQDSLASPSRAGLVAAIQTLIADLPTYGYRRVHALLRRQAERAEGLNPSRGEPAVPICLALSMLRPDPSRGALRAGGVLPCLTGPTRRGRPSHVPGPPGVCPAEKGTAEAPVRALALRTRLPTASAMSAVLALTQRRGARPFNDMQARARRRYDYPSDLRLQ